MVDILLGAAAVLASLAFIVMLMQCLAVFGLSSDRLRLESASGSAFAKDREYAASHDEWTAEMGFDPVGCYKLRVTMMPTGFIAAWQHRERATFLCLYRIGTTWAYDLATQFGRGLSLTTSNAKDSHALPHTPGDYNESVPGADLNALWDQHMTSEAYVTAHAGVRPETKAVEFEEEFVKALRKQALYIRSLPLWPLRTLYWFLIMRLRFRGLTLEDQVSRGLVASPRDVEVPRDT